MHKYIEYIKVIEKNDAFSENTDVGLFLIFKDNYLNKNKNVKKYNMVIFGDTEIEMNRNAISMSESITGGNPFNMFSLLNSEIPKRKKRCKK